MTKALLLRIDFWLCGAIAGLGGWHLPFDVLGQSRLVFLNETSQKGVKSICQNLCEDF